MDAHSRGRADGTEPADQWALDPRTGDYEPRPDRSGAESPQVPRPVGRRDSGSGDNARAGAAREAAGRRTPGSRDRTGRHAGPRREVPGQRGRRPAGSVRARDASGGSLPGAARATVAWLRNSQGVPHSTNMASAPAKIDRTTPAYAPNQADQARALAAMMGLPAAALKQGTTDAGELQAVVLTLGADFKGAGVPVNGPAKAPDGMQKSGADKAECAK